MIKQLQDKFLLMGLTLVVVIIGYAVLTAPDRRNEFQKLGDAIEQMPNGVDKAARELKSRTPADKISDAAKDATNSSNNQ